LIRTPSFDSAPVTVRVEDDTVTEPVPVIVINGFTKIDVVIEYVPLIANVLNVVDADPPMTLPLPVNVIVLVPAVKVPPLFVQLPPTEWLNDPAVKLVPVFRTASPAIVRAAEAVTEAVPEMVNAPAMLVALPGIVFVPLPDNVRIPYASLVTACADPA
jgi:hypothetical protein